MCLVIAPSNIPSEATTSILLVLVHGVEPLSFSAGAPFCPCICLHIHLHTLCFVGDAVMATPRPTSISETSIHATYLHDSHRSHPPPRRPNYNVLAGTATV